jgi:hypothetical protein
MSAAPGPSVFVVLAVLYGLTLYSFTSRGTDSQQVANNVVASMGVVTGVIGSLEAAPIGGQLFAHDNSQRDCTAF